MIPLVISGPSGVGKTTLNQMLLKEYKEFKLVVSLTTRKQRINEIEGEHYYFTTHERFQQHLDNEEFVETQQLFGNHYGTLYSELQRIQHNHNIPVFEIDIQGALQIHRSSLKANYLFIQPSHIQQLHHRLLARNTENTQQIQARLSQGIQEIQLAATLPMYDYLVNDHLHTSFAQFKQYLKTKYII